MVVQYLGVARQYEHHTRVEVPKLKHAPVNLGRQLEDYLHDPDFEIHRRQYLAELEAKRGKGSAKPFFTAKSDSATKSTSNTNNNNNSTPFPTVNGSSSTENKPAPVAKGPDPDLIDFFDSIEQNQTTLGAQPAAVPGQMGSSPWGASNGFQPQPTGFEPQPTGFQNGFAPQQTGFQATNPFQQQQSFQQPQQAPQQQQIPPSFTGAGFGGFTSQTGYQNSLAPIPQESAISTFQTGASMPNLQAPQQTTNPFRQSMMMTGQMTGQATGMVPQSATTNPPSIPPQHTSTNPFARSSPAATNPAPFQSPPPPSAPLQAMATGTNPFAKNFGAPAAQQQRPATSAGSLAPQATGTTNPFRQSQFVNHNTGMGWQNNQQPIGGGLDNLQTVPVFPRPAQQAPWQQ